MDNEKDKRDKRRKSKKEPLVRDVKPVVKKSKEVKIENVKRSKYLEQND